MSIKENELKQNVVIQMNDDTKNELVKAKENEIKREVVAAYNEVLRILSVAKSAAPKEEKEKEAQIEQAVAEEERIVDLFIRETPDEMVKHLNEMKVFVNKELKGIEEKLLPLYSRFHNLRRSIAFSEKELREQHNIKVNVNTLNALVMTQKEKIASFEIEMAERKRELESELMARRAAFEEEAATRESALSASENECRQLKEQAARMKACEMEYQQLKEKVRQFPDEMRAAVQRVERSLMEQLNRKHEYDTRLANIEWDSERKLYQQKITALEEQIEQYKLLKQQFRQNDYQADIAIQETEMDV